MTNEYLSISEVELIHQINQDLHILIEKYGKEKILWGAKWLLNPAIISTNLILIDDKNWKHEIKWESKERPPNIYRLRKWPNLHASLTLEECNQPLFHTQDCEFKMTQHKFLKRDCGCVDSIYEYEMIR